MSEKMIPDSAVPLLELQGLGKSFPPPTPLEVLSGIDLKVAAGETLAVVGSSGSGKTTLLHIIGTLERPSKGKVFFAGEDVFTRSSGQLALFRNQSIGFVFQFHHLLPEFSALENVMLPCLIAGEGQGEAREKAKELLGLIGLENRYSHRVGELSGGEQQRVAIARALVGKPRLLLADEPTGNLDPKTGQAVFELLKKLNLELGLTMIMVTHNHQLAASLDRVLLMEGGSLREIDGLSLAS